MNITLYKNCCLNNKYQEVFYHEKLETYLNSLDKYSLNLDETYYETNMELVIDYDWFQNQGGLFIGKHIYDYNYCKITETIGLTLQPNLIRYCFIKSINVKNGCVYLELEEDIWASFSSKILGTNTCVLVNSRRKYYGEGIMPTLLKLPYNYDGNNRIDYEILHNNGDCKCFVELQYYELTSGDKATNRHCEIVQLAMGGPGTVSYFEFNYAELTEGLEKLFNLITTGNVTKSGTAYKYEIGNVYVFPSMYNFDAIVDKTAPKFQTDVPAYLAGSQLFGVHDYSFYNLYKVYEGTIQNNYKILGIGTFSNQIKIENNGTDIEYSIHFGVSYSNLCLRLHVQNQDIDITNDFTFDIPYELLRSAEYEQRKIGLQIKNNNLNYGMFKSSVDISNDQNRIVGGIGKAIGSYNTGNVGGVFGGIEQAVSGLHETIKDIGTIVKLNKEKELINAPIYSNGKGIFSNSSYFLNYFNGMVLTKINPDNAELVKDFVNNFGFNCYMFLNDYWFSEVVRSDLYSESYFHYNAIRISSPNVYGSFTNEIANKLNSILENGVKIWYDPSKTEDGYNDDLLN